MALQEKYRITLQVIGISEDEAGVEVVQALRRRAQDQLPVVMMTPEIEKMFPGISALPTSFILDRESRVVQKHVGMLTARTTEFETRAPGGPAGQRVDRGSRSDAGAASSTTARRR